MCKNRYGYLTYAAVEPYNLGMEFKDYYKILGVDKKADEKEIKRAYRKLAREHHPDRNPNDSAAEDKLKEINEAYEVLGNPENRQKYDQLGANYHRYQQMGGQPGGFDFSQWYASGGGSGYQQVNFDDLFGGQGAFSDFFSTIFGERPSRGRSRAASFAQDLEHEVTITLEEAYHGTTRTLRVNGDRFTAKIPAGAHTGTRIRLRGKGSGADGAGDLYLNIRVEPHDTFRREGRNLKVDVNVDVLTAVLGGKASVPTLTGPITLTIPAGTQGGRQFRLRGKGMPDLQHNGEFGDLLARVQLQVPEKLTEQEKQLYEKLAALRREA